MSTPSRNPVSPDRPLFVGAGLSFFLLFTLAWLHSWFPARSALNLPMAWMGVSAVPLIVGLLLTERVRSFKIAGVEAVLNDLSVDEADERLGIVTAEVVLTGASTAEKGQVSAIPVASLYSPARLVFSTENAHRYDSRAIAKYLREIQSLQYLEITDPFGRLLYLFDKTVFVPMLSQGGLNIQNLELFVELIHVQVMAEDRAHIESHGPVDSLANLGQVPIVSEGTPARQLLKLLERRGCVAVADEDGKCLGVVTWTSVGRSLVRKIERA